MKQLGAVVICLILWAVAAPLSKEKLPETGAEYTEISADDTAAEPVEEKVLFAFEVPDSGKTVRIVDNMDYFSFGSSSVTIYLDAEKYGVETIANDGVSLSHRNFEAEYKENTVYLTIKGEEQADEIIAIPVK